MDSAAFMGNILEEYDKTKYNSMSAKKAKKIIRKAIVLNELEREKAKGIRKNVASVLKFINSGSPKLPKFTGKEDFEETLNNSNLAEKIAAIPICILFIPIIALKMGINSIKLARWMKQKPEILGALKDQGLLDNIEKFANKKRKDYNDNEHQEYIEHVLEDHRIFPNEYNELIDEMSAESRNRGFK